MDLTVPVSGCTSVLARIACWSDGPPSSWLAPLAPFGSHATFVLFMGR